MSAKIHLTAGPSAWEHHIVTRMVGTEYCFFLAFFLHVLFHFLEVCTMFHFSQVCACDILCLIILLSLM